MLDLKLVLESGWLMSRLKCSTKEHHEPDGSSHRKRFGQPRDSVCGDTLGERGGDPRSGIRCIRVEPWHNHTSASVGLQDLTL